MQEWNAIEICGGTIMSISVVWLFVESREHAWRKWLSMGNMQLEI